MDLHDGSSIDIKKLSEAEQIELIENLEWLDRYERQRKFYRFFPDFDATQADGSLIHAREKYPKHLEFFASGAVYRERCFLAANRVGKTIAGAFEVACHLTGEYPDWWNGRRFHGPVRVWAAGKTNETTRDILQATLLGEIEYRNGRKGFSGTGIIPGHTVGESTWKHGVADLADTVRVKHLRGTSMLGLKSYQQGRGSFEGTAQHGIWLDEEPPIEIYGECLTRTATVNGIVMITFTPLEGLSETVMQFLPKNQRTQ